eukprot:m.192896 g.192896  ORF g.192896 m.192896 type:complete len:104 (+) comp14868_c0_seq1:5312-5623(+)
MRSAGVPSTTTFFFPMTLEQVTENTLCCDESLPNCTKEQSIMSWCLVRMLHLCCEVVILIVFFSLFACMRVVCYSRFVLHTTIPHHGALCSPIKRITIHYKMS